jgi:hypothetical protein
MGPVVSFYKFSENENLFKEEVMLIDCQENVFLSETIYFTIDLKQTPVSVSFIEAMMHLEASELNRNCLVGVVTRLLAGRSVDRGSIPGRETDDTPKSSVQVKNAWSYVPTLPFVTMGLWSTVRE